MFKVENKIGAIFQCRVHKVDTGELVHETPKFSNIVLDSGLAMMNHDSELWGNTCFVGAGSTPPVASQTFLDEYVAETKEITNSQSTNNTTTAPYYLGFARTFRFGAGVAKGNLTEVCIGKQVWNGSVYLRSGWNRALIRDVNGDPTTLTVLDDEYLDVTVDVHIYPQHEVSGTFKFKNKLGEVISTHNYTGYSVIREPTGFTKALNMTIGTYSNAVIDPKPTQGITGTNLWYQKEAYSAPVTGTTRRHTAVCPLAQGNGSTDGVEILFDGFMSHDRGFGWSLKLDVPITKTNQQELTWQVVSTWGRL